MSAGVSGSTRKNATMRRSKAAFRSAVALAAVALTGCSATAWRSAFPATTTTEPTAPQEGWVPYRDPSGLSLEHPPDWEVQPGQLGPLFVFIDPGADAAGFRRNINILVETVPRSMTPDDYQSISNKQLEALHAHLDETASLCFSGLPGREQMWHFSRDGRTLRFLSVWTVANGRALLLTYTADDANFEGPLADVRRVASTVSLPQLSAVST